VCRTVQETGNRKQEGQGCNGDRQKHTSTNTPLSLPNDEIAIGIEDEDSDADFDLRIHVVGSGDVVVACAIESRGGVDQSICRRSVLDRLYPWTDASTTHPQLFSVVQHYLTLFVTSKQVFCLWASA
jgi:hypothetical protein